ncbi:4-hydroxybenzoate 3-monooxygenase [Streptomyces sp. NPDC059009]|uniref:4-hydroxybenzoate 3-monooxygenase n=1 Tax=Streptomyces sp. NPDC059009 TaxID=3346694 RepID=UPI00367C2CFF
MVIVGAGPAGLTLANILRTAAVDCVVLETESRDFIEQRPRAGFIEEWAVRGLDRHGLADRLLARAPVHSECEFRYGGARHTFRYAELTGHHHYVYPQQFLVTDLVRQYADEADGDIRFQVRDVTLQDIDSEEPSVTYTDPETGRRRRLACTAIAGCDGARGVTRTCLPAQDTTLARHDYGIGWLALLAEAPPSSDCVVFGIHPRGLAAHMARTPEITRYYLQCPPGDTPDDWPDARVWSELHTRLAGAGARPLTEGRLIEKRMLDMHNYVVAPMTHGRLHLAGDAAHLTAPIAAKGMNLALNDAFLLADALIAHCTRGDDSGLIGYSAASLRRVWHDQEFSEWFAHLLHGPSSGDPFQAGTAVARLDRILHSRGAAVAFAESYIGKDADG